MTTPSAAPPEPYTVFTRHQKHLLSVILSITTLASTLTATIYLPLLPLLATRLHTSAQAINLTITIYIIFQAISPAVFASLSDFLGRRPIYLTTFTIYVFASLGLALNRNSYAALLILRAMQSIGASAVLSIAYGVIADVCVPAERGKMLGPVLAATNLGVCIGPLVGGWIALWSKGYEWVFWSLLIYGGVTLMAVVWVLPETSRNIVGNGSIPAVGWVRPWWSIFKVREASNARLGDNRVIGDNSDAVEKTNTGKKTNTLKIASPLACLRIIFWKDTALCLWLSGSFYAVYYCIQTSLPSIFKDVYGFNEFQIGLSYLTGGAGVILGMLVNGRMIDRNYKVIAKNTGFTVDTTYGDDLKHFPIERARARGSRYLLGISVCALVGYGWAIEAHGHESIPLIFQFVLGLLCTCFNQTFSTLLVDIFPANPSTAAASGNVTRCALAALAVAAMQPLTVSLGRGWYFTLLGILSGVSGAAAIWGLTTRGMEWRSQRLSKSPGPCQDDRM